MPYTLSYLRSPNVFFQAESILHSDKKWERLRPEIFLRRKSDVILDIIPRNPPEYVRERFGIRHLLSLIAGESEEEPGGVRYSILILVCGEIS